MADHIRKEKENHLPSWNEVEIIDRVEYWRIRRLRKSALFFHKVSADMSSGTSTGFRTTSFIESTRVAVLIPLAITGYKC